MAPAASDPLPCQPFSVPDYLDRLGTFSSSGDWFDKPACLAPPVCARFGWILDGPDLLRSSCGAYIQAPAALSDGDAATTAFVEQLTSGHAALCPWRGHASPPSVASLLLPGHPTMPPSLPHGTLTARADLRARSLGLLALPALPALSSSADGAWAACAYACGYGEDLPAWRDALIKLAGLERSNSTLSAAELDRRWAAAALSLLGWSAASAASETIECKEDARTVGLWGYKSLKDAQASSSDTQAAGALEPFDPLFEHRSWSPWLETVEGDTLPAWMRIAVLLLVPAAAWGQQAAGRGASAAAVSSLLAAL